MIPTRIFGIFAMCVPWLWVVLMFLQSNILGWDVFWQVFVEYAQRPAVILFGILTMLLGYWVCRRPAAKVPFVLTMLLVCNSYVPFLGVFLPRL